MKAAQLTQVAPAGPVEPAAVTMVSWGGQQSVVARLAFFSTSSLCSGLSDWLVKTHFCPWNVLTESSFQIGDSWLLLSHISGYSGPISGLIFKSHQTNCISFHYIVCCKHSWKSFTNIWSSAYLLKILNTRIVFNHPDKALENRLLPMAA